MSKPTSKPSRAEASRRNGAKSQGPRSAEGKAASSRNAKKHGLFSAHSGNGPMPVAAQALSEMLDEILRGSAGSYRVAAAVAAEARLVEAVAISEHLDNRIAKELADAAGDTDRVGPLLLQRLRLGRYQRRFRGQRDRALRQLMRDHPELVAPWSAEVQALVITLLCAEPGQEGAVRETQLKGANPLPH